MHSDDFISVNLETYSDISLDWEQIVHVNDIIFTCGEEESTIRGESDCCYVGGMTIFVLFDQYEGLKCTIKTW